MVPVETSYDNTIRDAEESAKRTAKEYGRCRAVCESTGNMRIRTFETPESGIPAMPADPPKTRAIAEAKVKTDRADAETPAHLPGTDLVATCHVPDVAVRGQKQILRHRESLVQDKGIQQDGNAA